MFSTLKSDLLFYFSVSPLFSFSAFPIFSFTAFLFFLLFCFSAFQLFRFSRFSLICLSPFLLFSFLATKQLWRSTPRPLNHLSYSNQQSVFSSLFTLILRKLNRRRKEKRRKINDKCPNYNNMSIGQKR